MKPKHNIGDSVYVTYWVFNGKFGMLSPPSTLKCSGVIYEIHANITKNQTNFTYFIKDEEQHNWWGDEHETFSTETECDDYIRRMNNE